VVGGLVARLTLVQRFALVSLIILVVGAFVIGRYVAEELESDVTARNGAITALYVDSFVSPRLQGLGGGVISADKQQELDSLLTETSLGRDILSFKVWDTQGRIVYASDPALVGQQFDRQGGLASALGGDVHSSKSDLSEEEHEVERLLRPSLLETYAPIRADETGAIIGAMEFYQDPSDLEAEIESSQRNGWIIVSVSTAGMYLLLVGLVKGASSTLVQQHRRLQKMSDENAHLAKRVRDAASQKTETDEALVMRVARDLHDGPAQDLGLALLRVRPLREGSEDLLRGTSEDRKAVREDFALVETALARALKEVREISSDIRLPELQGLSLDETIEKAVSDHENKTGNKVTVQLHDIPPGLGLPLKIVAYRVIQEALTNSFRHAAGSDASVRASCADGRLLLEVADSGPGFEPSDERGSKRTSTPLGLRGMRERVELLSGSLEIVSSRDSGTTIRARFPLDDKVT
jgi:signal transduction histidine kinase